MSPTESDLVIVLSPITSLRTEERLKSLSAPLPSVRDCISSLDLHVDTLQDLTQDILDAASELEQKDQIRVDAVDEVHFDLDLTSGSGYIDSCCLAPWR